MSCCLVAKFVLAVVTARYVTLVSIVGRNTVYNGLGYMISQENQGNILFEALINDLKYRYKNF